LGIPVIAKIQEESTMNGQNEKSNGTFEVTIGGEPKNFIDAEVTIANSESGGTQKVNFSKLEGQEAYESVTVRFTYSSEPGTYEVLPGSFEAPGATYGVEKSGGWFTAYNAVSGTVTLISADEATQAMKGSFSFQVSVEDVTTTTTIAGTFDLHR